MPGSVGHDLNPRFASAIRMLDPCAGKGRALALLAHILQTQAQQCVPSAAPDEHRVSAVAVSDTATTDAARATDCAVPTLTSTESSQTRSGRWRRRSAFPTCLRRASSLRPSLKGLQLAFVNLPYDLEAEADSASAAHSAHAGGGDSSATGEARTTGTAFPAAHDKQARARWRTHLDRAAASAP